MKLVFDTETTGLVAWHLPASDPAQPRLVQFAAVLVDDAWQEVSVVSLLVKPENFLIPREASRVHGITTERAASHGVPVQTALSLFAHLVKAAREVWAFNAQYDQTVMLGELHRIDRADFLQHRKIHCAMLACKDILKLPPPPDDRRIYPGRQAGDYKWPKLIEAHQFFFGGGYDNTHDALGDVRATLRVMRATQEWLRRHPAAPATEPMRPFYTGD